MHRITASLLKAFSESYGYSGLDQAEKFELFVNHCVIAPETVEGYDLMDVTTGSTDEGIDGCAVVIDEEVVVSKEDCESIFDDGKRQHDATLVLTQAKSSESLELGELLKFHRGVERFCLRLDDQANDPTEENCKEVFRTVIDSAARIRFGKPRLKLRYAYTGLYKFPGTLETARLQLKERLEDSGFFREIDFEVMDRNGIGTAYNSTVAPNEAKINVFTIAALPQITGIEEAYLAVVPAKDFVGNLLADEEGRLRNHVFEENVRAFLGVENPVNSAISQTLKKEDVRTRFPVLNNGITAVSPDVRVQGNTITLINYQIVNGCQTSNVLWENRSNLTSDVMVTIKVIETTSEDIFSDLVRATNSQTKIDDDQFLSLQPIARRIETYFNSFEQDEARLYFERRDRQYVGHDVPGVKIFDLKLLARCVSATFLSRPDLSFRYPRKIFSDETISHRVFRDDNREVIYYAACLIYYRMNILFSNRQLPREARRFKWHIMALFFRRTAGKNPPPMYSPKVETFCQRAIDLVRNEPNKCKDALNECFEVFAALGEVSDDRLKRQAIWETVVANEP